MNNVNDKVAIITGASRGIGKAVAIDLAKQGYRVVLMARTEKTLRDVQKEIQDFGGNAAYYAFDISNLIAIEKYINEIIAKFGKIDVLFNNAGIARAGTSSAETQDINDILEINLKAAIYFVKYVALQMKQQKSGYIFNVSSTSGKRAVPIFGIYAASKFGLVGFNEALFKELMSYGIKVTAICPSFVATDMTSKFDFAQQLMIQTDDIVKTVNYLLSLGKTAAVKEIVINCAPYVAQETQALMQKLAYKSE